MPAVHVAKHIGVRADAGRRIEGVQGANCFEVCIIDTVTVHADGRMTFKFQGGTVIES